MTSSGSMPESPVLKLQGTDGVRAVVSTEHVTMQEAVDRLLDGHQLTPAFCTLYAKAFCQLLATSGYADQGCIAFAEDGRDYWSGSGLKGAILAGLGDGQVHVDDLGIVPTPVLAAYSYVHRIAAVMLTASHNPAHYNGIKLFVNGIKLYPDGPVGEYALTELVLEIAKQTGGVQETHRTAAGSAFVHKVDPKAFALDVFLRYLGDNFAIASLGSSPVLLDAANGAWSSLALGILSRVGVHAVPSACTPAPGAINADSGVGVLEHLDPEVPFSDSLPPTAKRLFEIGRSSGAPHAFAIVLDGDGDRAFLLQYHRASDTMTVLDGDALAYLILEDRQQHDPRRSVSDDAPNALFISTIESNHALNPAIARAFGWDVDATCVGDRWLVDVGLSSGRDFVGCEKSGHVVLPLMVPDHDQPLATGNGLVTAVLALARLANSPDRTYPFQQGASRSISLRQCRREAFYRGSPSWNAVRSLVEETVPWECRTRDFPQESDLLYYDLLETGNRVGSWYMRKSGTEPKITATMQAEGRLQAEVQTVMTRMERLLPPLVT